MTHHYPIFPDDETMPQDPLYFIESFAGEAQASRCVQSAFPEKVTAALDVKFSETLDININSGMASPG